MSGHSMIRKLWDLFEEYDQRASEFIRREGVDIPHRWPHRDVDGRPE